MSTSADPYDWTRFDVHMIVPCDPGTAYDCWATGAGMERFFARTWAYAGAGGGGGDRDPEERAEVGDAYRMAFHHPAALDGTVLAAEDDRHLAFSFGPMRVDVRIEPLNGRSLVALTQSDIAESDLPHSHLNCRSCWVYYLLNLRSVIEHGHDLRDDGLPDNPVGIDFAARWAEVKA